MSIREGVIRAKIDTERKRNTDEVRFEDTLRASIGVFKHKKINVKDYQ